MTAFDLVVLGGGSAGFAGAIRAAELGARVAIVEGATLGGTCVNVGCIPSKTLLRAAEANYRRKHHGFEGIPRTNGDPIWSSVRAEKDALVTTLRQAKYADVLRSYDAITLFQEHAAVAPGPAVCLAGGRTLTADRVLLAMGASPWAPPLPGLTEAGYLDNATAMDLEHLPESIVVIGGSAVGLELAQMFARLGVRVTVLEAQARIVPAEDPALGDSLAEYLRHEGLDLRTGVRIERVNRHPAGYSIIFREGGESQTTTASQLLVATGRRPNTAGLGLEAIGVTLGPKKEVVVDEFLQTTTPGIYAAGDVLGDPMFVYVAAYGGNLAAENALSGNSRQHDLSALPRVTFTDPAIASVGFTEDQAQAHGVKPLIARLSLTHVPRALAARDTRGFIKLIADGANRKLVGAHILAAEAGEMVTEAVLAIKLGLTIDDLTSTFHPYLTLSEGIKLAAQSFDRDIAALSCCAA